jgi:hypothetical protein
MFLSAPNYILQEPQKHPVLQYERYVKVNHIDKNYTNSSYVFQTGVQSLHYSYVPLLLSTTQFSPRCVVLSSQGYKSKQQCYGVLKTFSCQTVKKTLAAVLLAGVSLQCVEILHSGSFRTRNCNRLSGSELLGLWTLSTEDGNRSRFRNVLLLYLLRIPDDGQSPQTQWFWV